MFILRKYTKEGLELNYTLGFNYSVIFSSNDTFSKAIEEQKDQGIPDLIGYVHAVAPNDEKVCIRIHEKESAYIMTESGNTFARLI